MDDRGWLHAPGVRGGIRRQQAPFDVDGSAWTRRDARVESVGVAEAGVNDCAAARGAKSGEVSF